ncbi:acyltransferase-like protein [Murinocardiopsis flavida]|uniref:Acyltransferase-like protein n=1 Tax=Murinocardiopsis flavida TaxID=645275 RepID=A0A2P8CXB7_9ACTN|nr:acyltransferase family protein [Murinocardiopsis flavida]PSK89618.1 acyltransferase-like protein [Murinocardiopsis flavida]
MRKHYIDRLRNAAILFLFPYHAARVFDDISPFYAKGAPSAAASVLVHSSFWFMPLLFLLAGMSSYHALQRRTAAEFAKERFARLLVPFFFGALVVVPPQAYYAMRFHLGYRGGYGEFLVRYFTDFSDWSEYAGGISPAHLWFLLFLFLISIALLPLMRLAARAGYAPAWPRHPLLVLLPFAGPALLSVLPDASGKNIAVYAAYVMLGYFIAADDAVTDMIEKHRAGYLAGALAGAAGILAETYTVGAQSSALSTAAHFLVCWTTLLAILGYGRRYLSGGSTFDTYFNPAALPVYILHQTYLVIAAYYIIQFADSGPAPFILIMISSFGLSIASYAAIRRIRPLRVAFGLPERSAAAAMGSRGRTQ